MITWDAVSIYSGYAIALFLCRGLGVLFFVPMVLNLIFDLCVRYGVMSGWDIRWVMASYGLLFFVWVLALSGIPNKVTFFVLALAELGSVFHGLAPELAAVGSGKAFWYGASTTILHVWFTSIFVVAGSAIIRGTIISVHDKGFVTLLTIPRQRFMVPIAMWSGMIMIPHYLHGIVPEWLYQNRFLIAGHLLVWGWVAFELPFYIIYKRIGRNGA